MLSWLHRYYDDSDFHSCDLRAPGGPMGEAGLATSDLPSSSMDIPSYLV